MAQFEIDDDIILRSFEPEDADELFALVDRNRAYLGRFLSFVELTLTSADTQLFIDGTIKQESNKNGFHRAIVKSGAMIGTIGFHSIERPNRTTTMGYWISAEYQGQGIVSKAVAQLVNHAFVNWHLNRIEIHAAVDNHRSRAIPERMGFTHEGTRREAECVGGRFHDMAMYGLLSAEWSQIDPGPAAQPQHQKLPDI